MKTPATAQTVALSLNPVGGEYTICRPSAGYPTQMEVDANEWRPVKGLKPYANLSAADLPAADGYFNEPLAHVAIINGKLSEKFK